MANEGSRAAARALILKVTRAGFKQYRKVNDGWLYGSGTYRFMIPYSVVKQGASPTYIEELAQKFEKIREARDLEYGKPPPPDPDLTAPIENPEDLLRDEEGGPPDAGPEAMNLADEGSTPSPPAMETERSASLDASKVGEGSKPSGLPTPNPEEHTTMAKRREDGNRYPNPWTCPKCGQTFAHAGRHASACTGKPKEAKTTRKRSVPEQVVTQEQARQNGHGTLGEALKAFTEATGDLVTLVKNLEGEVQLYRRENEELRAFKQRASALFEAPSRVPRA